MAKNTEMVDIDISPVKPEQGSASADPALDATRKFQFGVFI